MKRSLLLFSCLILSLFSLAQAYDNSDHLKIIVSKDSVHVGFKDKLIRLNSIQDLDSFLKNNMSEMTSPVVDLEAHGELTSQEHRAIIVIMDKYLIPVVSEKTVPDGKLHRISFLRRN